MADVQARHPSCRIIIVPVLGLIFIEPDRGSTILPSLLFLHPGCFWLERGQNQILVPKTGRWRLVG